MRRIARNFIFILFYWRDPSYASHSFLIILGRVMYLSYLYRWNKLGNCCCLKDCIDLLWSTNLPKLFVQILYYTIPLPICLFLHYHRLKLSQDMVSHIPCMLNMMFIDFWWLEYSSLRLLQQRSCRLMVQRCWLLSYSAFLRIFLLWIIIRKINFPDVACSCSGLGLLLVQ